MAKDGAKKRKGLGHVPGSILDLIERLGAALAFKLLDIRGGSILWVPSQAASDHPLRKLLSDEGFEKLVSEYRGERLELPKNDSIARQYRHKHIQELRERGFSLTEMASMSNYTRRHVVNVLNASATPLPQLDLFDDHIPERDVGYDQGLPSAHDPFGLRRR